MKFHVLITDLQFIFCTHNLSLSFERLNLKRFEENFLPTDGGTGGVEGGRLHVPILYPKMTPLKKHSINCQLFCIYSKPVVLVTVFPISNFRRAWWCNQQSWNLSTSLFVIRLCSLKSILYRKRCDGGQWQLERCQSPSAVATMNLQIVISARTICDSVSWVFCAARGTIHFSSAIYNMRSKLVCRCSWQFTPQIGGITVNRKWNSLTPIRNGFLYFILSLRL